MSDFDGMVQDERTQKAGEGTDGEEDESKGNLIWGAEGIGLDWEVGATGDEVRCTYGRS